MFQQELIKWMEAIKPDSASLLIKQANHGRSSPQPSTLPQVTAFHPEPTEHAYQPLPDSFIQNPRRSGVSRKSSFAKSFNQVSTELLLY